MSNRLAPLGLLLVLFGLLAIQMISGAFAWYHRLRYTSLDHDEVETEPVNRA